MCQPRDYRHWIGNSDLVPFKVLVKQTDLHIQARRSLKDKALKSVLKHRASLEEYVLHHPLFLTTLEPYEVEQAAPVIVKRMAEASQLACVGPMAAVAGAIAEMVGTDLLRFTPEVIVENGGDIFLRILKKRVVGIYAGQSRVTGNLALEIKPQDTPLGICASSASVGHSLSLGTADAVIALSPSAPLADALATAVGNMIGDTGDIPKTLEKAKRMPQLCGLVIVKGDTIGAWGKVRLVSLG
ncbi:MAG: UPF0280 family protein [Dehalococcoidia bacterium]|nr:UPF0280 family protein [Dehalococcoidia bacterium]